MEFLSSEVCLESRPCKGLPARTLSKSFKLPLMSARLRSDPGSCLLVISTTRTGARQHRPRLPSLRPKIKLVLRTSSGNELLVDWLVLGPRLPPELDLCPCPHFEAVSPSTA